MSFLPENYKQPETQSSYLKFKDGETEFRILSDSITGYVYFDAENKPHRSKDMPIDRKEHAKINEKSGKQDQPKHFWSFIVRSYSMKKVCILDITQKSIQNLILAYYHNNKRGDPKDYDLTVTRKGEGLDTEYSVIASPKTPITEEQAKAFIEAKIDLNKLYSGEDPFSS